MAKKRRKLVSTESVPTSAGTKFTYDVLPQPDLSIEEKRAEAVHDLGALGLERLRLMAELNKIDEILRPRVDAATSAGVSYRRITELTGYSRSTISRWTREPSDS